MFEKYEWKIVGNIVTKDKKSRADEDLMFLKMFNDARKMFKSGWLREAVLKLKTPNGKVYYIQCITWRDKKSDLYQQL